MRIDITRTPVTASIEQTPANHVAWVKLALPEGPTGLEDGISLALEFNTTNAEAVAIIAAFLNANLKNLVVYRAMKAD